MIMLSTPIMLHGSGELVKYLIIGALSENGLGRAVGF